MINYAIHLLIYFEIYVIVALSLNLVVGYCGMLTLANAAYFAIGGYGYALLTLKLGCSFLPSIFFTIFIVAILSLALSFMACRLKGDFFVLASLAVHSLLFGLLYNWSDSDAPIGTWKNLTNGPKGIGGIPAPVVFGYTIDKPSDFFWFTTTVTVFCAFLIWKLNTSAWVRVLVSMREDELAVRNLGKNTHLLKLQVFMISCGLTAIAGALYAAYISYLDLRAASLDESILVLSMVIVGGVGNLRGPIVGALILIALPELLRLMDLPDATASNIRLVIYGFLLVIMMHFRPQGLCGEYKI